jgi:hypothetical protein
LPAAIIATAMRGLPESATFFALAPIVFTITEPRVPSRETVSSSVPLIHSYQIRRKLLNFSIVDHLFTRSEPRLSTEYFCASIFLLC